jgi:cell division septation protein DedD
VLQIGSFPEEDQAASKLKLLRGKGVKEAFAKEVNLGSKGKWYRVYVGPFTSKDLAEKSGSQYKSQRKVDSFIVTRLTTE